MQEKSNIKAAFRITIGTTVKFQQGKKVLSGFTEDISDSGELLIRMTSGKLEAVKAGDVVILD